MPENYAWYKVIRANNDLQQGDIFFNFPIYIPRTSTPAELEQKGQNATVDEKTANVIIMSQSCDLLKMRSTVNTPVIVCPLFSVKEQVEQGKMRSEDWEPLVKEEIVSARIIKSSEHRSHTFGFQKVLLKQVYTVPYKFLKTFSDSYGTRVRLLPPYREHLAQAFAKQFMRVGLPNDLPRTYPYRE